MNTKLAIFDIELHQLVAVNVFNPIANTRESALYCPQLKGVISTDSRRVDKPDAFAGGRSAIDLIVDTGFVNGTCMHLIPCYEVDPENRTVRLGCKDLPSDYEVDVKRTIGGKPQMHHAIYSDITGQIEKIFKGQSDANDFIKYQGQTFGREDLFETKICYYSEVGSLANRLIGCSMEAIVQMNAELKARQQSPTMTP
ncbi:hypothetical protein AB6D11_00610 [Vibrio splendidus]